eukprot:1151985-Pelagomonas_calceolata.AAC.6
MANKKRAAGVAGGVEPFQQEPRKSRASGKMHALLKCARGVTATTHGGMQRVGLTAQGCTALMWQRDCQMRDGDAAHLAASARFSNVSQKQARGQVQLPCFAQRLSARNDRPAELPCP